MTYRVIAICTDPVVFLQVSTLLSRGARESQDNVSGLSTGLNKGIMGPGNTDC